VRICDGGIKSYAAVNPIIPNLNNMENKLTEIARSFAYKLNIGNYQSADFFCSQKMEVPVEEAEETSKQLFHFCKSMVMKDVNNYIKENNPEAEVIDIKSMYPKEVLIDLGDAGIFPKSKKQKLSDKQKEFWKKEEMADIEQSNKKGD